MSTTTSPFSLLVFFNSGKWKNNELAWTLNTNNMWDDWIKRV